MNERSVEIIISSTNRVQVKLLILDLLCKIGIEDDSGIGMEQKITDNSTTVTIQFQKVEG